MTSDEKALRRSVRLRRAAWEGLVLGLALFGLFVMVFTIYVRMKTGI